MRKAVVVTGVARYLGACFARMLGDDPAVGRVIGIDVVPPQHDLGRCEFERADIRNPVVADVITKARVDTVVHMNVLATPVDAGGRAPQKEINVIGTMQLLAACQKAPTVRRLVVKSSTTVYGASPRDPAIFTEEIAPKALPRSGFAKDSVEVEGYVRGFSRRRPDVYVTTLRFANFVGPTVRTPLTEYFTMPVLPVVIGHDARLQFVHEDDGLAALRLATVEDRPGTYNVAGDGIMLLSQAARRAGRPNIPVPGLVSSTVGAVLRRAKLADFSPEQIQFLTYGRGVDTTRMREQLGFEPKYTTAQAFDSFVDARCRGGILDPDRLRSVERTLVGLLRGSAGGGG
ncbi:MAG: NAD-dependent epimerase/dehydratase family protein [Jiangellaceae bacterium]|nr:NAD-dependent epimerase/dehydratase family protein [Jiangellaceae bacterium]